MIFILSSISRGLELSSVNNTSIYKNSESNFLINIKFLGEISNDWPKGFIRNKCLQGF